LSKHCKSQNKLLALFRTFKKNPMISHPFTHETLSYNVYVRRTQLINRLAVTGAIWHNQLFTNEILYRFSDLRTFRLRTLAQLKQVEKEILKLESNLDLFGGSV